jgi:IS5 family transposase
MHQTKEVNQWYFGMKAHVGVDSKTKMIQSAVVMPANVADSRVLPELLHGEETRVWSDKHDECMTQKHAPEKGDRPAYGKVCSSNGSANAEF